MTEQTFLVENVGGVERLELTLRPGVSVIKSPNGTGKTSAIRALERATGGEVPLEKRDGTERGRVTGPGVKLSVVGVVRTTGKAEVELADSAPLSRLIDPQLRDSDAAARARIRALVELLGLRIDDESLSLLCGGDADLVAWLTEHCREHTIEDMMDAAEALRNHTHALARQSESAMSEAEGMAQAATRRAEEIVEALGGEGKLCAEDPGECAAGLQRAVREHERVQARYEARVGLEERQAAIRGSLGERPNTGPAEVRIEEAEASVEAIGEEISQLEQQLAAARERRAAAQRQRTEAESELEAVKAAGLRWDAQKAILEEKVEGASEEGVAQAATAISLAEALLERATRSAAHRQAQAEHREADAERDRAEAEAQRLRRTAHTLPSRLGTILTRAGARGLTVVDGRLAAVGEDGQPRDFERRLSEGQRVRAALDVAAQVYAGRVVALSGSCWASLDPEAQRHFAALAVERELRVITEQPAEGEMRVEWMGGEKSPA